MCGRFTLRTPTKDVVAAFDLVEALPLFPHYNIAPTQLVACVRESAATGQRVLVMLRWGLIPGWADDPTIGNRMINARAETVATKPAFRQAFKSRRCLVVADGFYEWQKTAAGKQPFFIHLKDNRPFGFAGLWEHWEGAEGPIESCTIITTEANPLMQSLHDRMPVIVPRDRYARWLDSAPDDLRRLEELLAPYPEDEMSAYPVSTLVNSPRNDSPDCVQPLDPTGGQKSLF